MGFALYDLHIPCTKTTSSLLFLERDAVSEAKQIQTACINCGRCVSVCPGHVVPARLATLAEHGDMAGFEKMDGMECCECVKRIHFRLDRKSTRLNSSHTQKSRMPSSA